METAVSQTVHLQGRQAGEESICFYQFNPKDIQADQIDPLLLREKQGQAFASLPLTQRHGATGEQGLVLAQPADSPLALLLCRQG